MNDTSALTSLLQISDRTSEADDERIMEVRQLPPPEHLIRFFPINGTPVESLIRETRQRVRAILHGTDDRLLVVMGPCSIHDPKAALDYATKLVVEKERYKDTLEIVMRVYCEKPRTTVGWKGLINDPYLDESCRIDEGLRIARQLLIEINRIGVAAGSEFLDVISPQYVGDLISWGTIGARTTESQVHRELASGLSAPIGFKNGTDGSLKIAMDAIQASSKPHSFLSVHKNGFVSIVKTRGNPDSHVILRGGKTPNYGRVEVEDAGRQLREAGLAPRVMVDCSHANSRKNFERQVDVIKDVAHQVAGGCNVLFGTLIESNIVSGAQKFTPSLDDVRHLEYGKSITDGCLGWDQSAEALHMLSDAVHARRKSRSQ